MVLFQIGLGYAAATINFLVGLYYNVVIAYCIYYLVVSIQNELPWKNCGDVSDCFVRTDLTMNCATEKAKFSLKNSKLVFYVFYFNFKIIFKF